MKYLRVKYLISLWKTLYWKIIYQGNLKLESIYLGFEQHVRIIIKSNGKINIGNHTYVSRRTDIESYGGKISIGSRTFINKDCIFVSRESITIGENTIFGEQVSVYDHDHLFNPDRGPYRDQGFLSKPIVIGKNVWVGCKVFIGKGVSIGNNSIIAAGSIVVKDIPDNVIFYNGKIKSLRMNDKG